MKKFIYSILAIIAVIAICDNFFEMCDDSSKYEYSNVEESVNFEENQIEDTQGMSSYDKERLDNLVEELQNLTNKYNIAIEKLNHAYMNDLSLAFYTPDVVSSARQYIDVCKKAATLCRKYNYNEQATTFMEAALSMKSDTNNVLESVGWDLLLD